ncbi:MAG: hypothetical protein HEQ25_08040 [Dolichospermum sp. DET73]|jgi:hypothetical protein|nr:hypothetical protein [Dolichospermum sp. DET73]
MKENKQETLIEEISDKESEMIKGGIQICIRPSIPFRRLPIPEFRMPYPVRFWL